MGEEGMVKYGIVPSDDEQKAEKTRETKAAEHVGTQTDPAIHGRQRRLLRRYMERSQRGL